MAIERVGATAAPVLIASQLLLATRQVDERHRRLMVQFYRDCGKTAAVLRGYLRNFRLTPGNAIGVASLSRSMNLGKGQVFNLGL